MLTIMGRTSSNEPKIIQPCALVRRVRVDCIFHQVKLVINCCLLFLLVHILGQLAKKFASVVPCRVVGKVLTDLGGSKIELCLRTIQDLFVGTLVL